MEERTIIEIDEELCNGCGLCIPGCAEGALKIVDGKARLVSDVYCDGLGACLGHCPQGALRIVEREAPPFDEEAVHEYLAEVEGGARGCPSAAALRLEASGDRHDMNGSALMHWPVQLNLVPPRGPRYDDADLLVVADCVPVAHPDFYGSLLSGRVVVVGCPKFDDVRGYGRKLADILRDNDVRSVTVAVMEVPCCSSLSRVVGWAVEASGKRIPVRRHVVGVRGEMS